MVESNVEIWRPVVCHDGIYSISRTGDVQSRYGRGRNKILGPWRLLKPVLRTDGYLFVWLYLNGKKTKHLIHHLVADAFLPPKGPTDTVVRHLNDNKLDNRVENLARGTRSDNLHDASRNGRSWPKGESHYGAKLTEENVREIRRLYATGNFTQAELGLQFGVSKAAICDIVRRKTWKHIEEIEDIV
jgi:hypothetical protein